MASLRLVSSSVLQNYVTGLEKKLVKAFTQLSRATCSAIVQSRPADLTKATPSGITVSGLGHSLLSRRAGGSTHYAIIHHSNLKVT